MLDPNAAAGADIDADADGIQQAIGRAVDAPIRAPLSVGFGAEGQEYCDERIVRPPEKFSEETRIHHFQFRRCGQQSQAYVRSLHRAAAGHRIGQRDEFLDPAPELRKIFVHVAREAVGDEAGGFGIFVGDLAETEIRVIKRVD